MADTETETLPNGTGGALSEEDERLKDRPADIDADVREMERRKRVEALMSSKLFREELERVLDQQLHDGSDAPLLQRIKEMVGGRLHTGSFRGPSCVLPINDIRGIEGVGYEKGEKILRCKLAAAYRLVDLFGWTQTGLSGQITARLNTAIEQVLTTPRGVLPHEVTASSLVKVDMQGTVVDQGTTNFPVNVEGFSVHGMVHAARPDLRCVLHVRAPQALAVSAMKKGLLPLCTEAALLGDIAYHHLPYGTLDNEEQEKLVRALGPHAKVLILTSAGALCCGSTLEEAFYQARNLTAACDVQLRLAALPLDQLQLIDDDTRRQIYESSRKNAGDQQKWRVGGEEFEALMRMLDNAGFRTGYVYRHPLIKNDVPRPKNDVEVPPAVSSLGYLLEEEELYRQGIWKKGHGKVGERTRWLNSPNVYQRVEVLETGTTDPKKITKWVDANNEEWVQDGSPQHSSTPVKIDTLQFVPKNTNPKEFKKLQQQIKENRRADKISAGPQSHILEGVTWDEAAKLVGEDAANTATGDHVVLMGAASKGIIQRGYQHNATVYSAPYARNPFDRVSDSEIADYRRIVERKQRSDYDTDVSESEPLSGAQFTSPLSETEEESRDEHRVLRIETKKVPVRSQPEIVLSDDFLNAERAHADRIKEADHHPNILPKDEVIATLVSSPAVAVAPAAVKQQHSIVRGKLTQDPNTLTEALTSNQRSKHDYSRTVTFENAIKKFSSPDNTNVTAFSNAANIRLDHSVSVAKVRERFNSPEIFDNTLFGSNSSGSVATLNSPVYENVKKFMSLSAGNVKKDEVTIVHPKCKVSLNARLSNESNSDTQPNGDDATGEKESIKIKSNNIKIQSDIETDYQSKDTILSCLSKLASELTNDEINLNTKIAIETLNSKLASEANSNAETLDSHSKYHSQHSKFSSPDNTNVTAFSNAANIRLDHSVSVAKVRERFNLPEFFDNTLESNSSGNVNSPVYENVKKLMSLSAGNVKKDEVKVVHPKCKVSLNTRLSNESHSDTQTNGDDATDEKECIKIKSNNIKIQSDMKTDYQLKFTIKDSSNLSSLAKLASELKNDAINLNSKIAIETLNSKLASEANSNAETLDSHSKCHSQHSKQDSEIYAYALDLYNPGNNSPRSSLYSIPSIDWDGRCRSDNALRTRSLPRQRKVKEPKLYRTQSHSGFINSRIKDPEPTHFHLPRCNSCGATNVSYTWELIKEDLESIRSTGRKPFKFPTSVYVSVNDIPQKCLEEANKVKVTKKVVPVYKVAKLDEDFVESQEFNEDNYFEDIGNSFSSENQTVIEKGVHVDQDKTITEENSNGNACSGNNLLDDKNTNKKMSELKSEEHFVDIKYTTISEIEVYESENNQFGNKTSEREDVTKENKDEADFSLVLHNDNDEIKRDSTFSTEGEYHSFSDDLDLDTAYVSPVKELVEKDIRDYSVPIGFYCDDYRKENSPTKSPKRHEAVPKSPTGGNVLEPILEESKSSCGDDLANLSNERRFSDEISSDTTKETQSPLEINKDIEKPAIETTILSANKESECLFNDVVEAYKHISVEISMKSEPNSSSSIDFIHLDKVQSKQENDAMISINDNDHLFSDLNTTEYHKEIIEANTDVVTTIADDVKTLIKDIFTTAVTAGELKMELSSPSSQKVTLEQLRTECLHKDSYFIADEDELTTNDVESITTNVVQTAVDTYLDDEDNEREQVAIADSVYENVFEIMSEDAISTTVDLDSEKDKSDIEEDATNIPVKDIVYRVTGQPDFENDSQNTNEFAKEIKKETVAIGESITEKMKMHDWENETFCKTETEHSESTFIKPSNANGDPPAALSEIMAITERKSLFEYSIASSGIELRSFDSTVEFEKYEIISDVISSILNRIDFEQPYDMFQNLPKENPIGFDLEPKERDEFFDMSMNARRVESPECTAVEPKNTCYDSQKESVKKIRQSLENPENYQDKTDVANNPMADMPMDGELEMEQSFTHSIVIEPPCDIPGNTTSFVEYALEADTEMREPITQEDFSITKIIHDMELKVDLNETVLTDASEIEPSLAQRIAESLIYYIFDSAFCILSERKKLRKNKKTKKVITVAETEDILLTAKSLWTSENFLGPCGDMPVSQTKNTQQNNIHSELSAETTNDIVSETDIQIPMEELQTCLITNNTVTAISLEIPVHDGTNNMTSPRVATVYDMTFVESIASDDMVHKSIASECPMIDEAVATENDMAHEAVATECVMINESVSTENDMVKESVATECTMVNATVAPENDVVHEFLATENDMVRDAAATEYDMTTPESVVTEDVIAHAESFKEFHASKYLNTSADYSTRDLTQDLETVCNTLAESNRDFEANIEIPNTHDRHVSDKMNEGDDIGYENNGQDINNIESSEVDADEYIEFSEFVKEYTKTEWTDQGESVADTKDDSFHNEDLEKSIDFDSNLNQFDETQHDYDLDKSGDEKDNNKYTDFYKKSFNITYNMNEKLNQRENKDESCNDDGNTSFEIAREIVDDVMERSLLEQCDSDCERCKEFLHHSGFDKTFVLDRSTDHRMNTAFVVDSPDDLYSRSSSPLKESSAFERCTESPIKNPANSFEGDDLSVFYEKDDTILGSPFVKQAPVLTMSQTENSGGVKYWISFDDSLTECVDRPSYRSMQRFAENKVPSFVSFSFDKDDTDDQSGLEKGSFRRSSILLEDTDLSKSTDTNVKTKDSYASACASSDYYTFESDLTDMKAETNEKQKKLLYDSRIDLHSKPVDRLSRSWPPYEDTLFYKIISKFKMSDSFDSKDLEFARIGEHTVNGDHSDAHQSTFSHSSKEGSPSKDVSTEEKKDKKKKKKGLRTPSFLKKKKEKKKEQTPQPA